VPNFFFGCEGDDAMTALAFKTKKNAFGARLNVLYSSDLGHFRLARHALRRQRGVGAG
jgi:hypothetical protein